MARLTDTSSNPVFWRDPALPFFEARWVQDGRKVCYQRHWHETFSVGVITGGCSTYINGRHTQRVSRGATVVMNPGEVHACNPIGDDPWSYRMCYVDSAWLGRMQGELRGSDESAFRPYASIATYSSHLYAAFNDLFAALTDADSDQLKRHVSILGFVSHVQNALEPGPSHCIDAGQKVVRAATYIDDNFTRPLKLDDICAAADLSASYLIRAFKKRYGVAPHEYQTNRRIQYGKAQLRRGRPIAEVALEAGFADQAHFQRIFKRLTAATPGQYRS